MTELRTTLSRDLTEMIEAHHLVVWQDDAGAFGDIARELVPSDCRFEAFEGSWVALRHRVEQDLSLSEPPRLVIYVPVQAPEQDPLGDPGRGLPFRAVRSLDRAPGLERSTPRSSGE